MNEDWRMWIKVKDDTGFIIFEGHEGHFSDCYGGSSEELTEQEVLNFMTFLGDDITVEFSSYTDSWYHKYPETREKMIGVFYDSE